MEQAINVYLKPSSTKEMTETVTATLNSLEDGQSVNFFLLAILSRDVSKYTHNFITSQLHALWHKDIPKPFLKYKCRLNLIKFCFRKGSKINYTIDSTLKSNPSLPVYYANVYPYIVSYANIGEPSPSQHSSSTVKKKRNHCANVLTKLMKDVNIDKDVISDIFAFSNIKDSKDENRQGVVDAITSSFDTCPYSLIVGIANDMSIDLNKEYIKSVPDKNFCMCFGKSMNKSIASLPVSYIDFISNLQPTTPTPYGSRSRTIDLDTYLRNECIERCRILNSSIGMLQILKTPAGRELCKTVGRDFKKFFNSIGLTLEVWQDFFAQDCRDMSPSLDMTGFKDLITSIFVDESLTDNVSCIRDLYNMLCKVTTYRDGVHANSSLNKLCNSSLYVHNITKKKYVLHNPNEDKGYNSVIYGKSSAPSCNNLIFHVQKILLPLQEADFLHVQR